MISPVPRTEILIDIPSERNIPKLRKPPSGVHSPSETRIPWVFYAAAVHRHTAKQFTRPSSFARVTMVLQFLALDAALKDYRATERVRTFEVALVHTVVHTCMQCVS